MPEDWKAGRGFWRMPTAPCRKPEPLPTTPLKGRNAANEIAINRQSLFVYFSTALNAALQKE
jgi:hypothetical protein